MLFMEFKNLSSLSRYETSKWALFSENFARYTNIGENPLKSTQNKPSNYIRALPIHPIAMKIGTIVVFWMRNKTCFLDF